MEEQKSIDWRDNVLDNPIATLKIQDGESKFITFLNEGKTITSKDYGESIAFEVQEETKTDTMIFYVNPQNYALLKQIKALGSLIGKKVKVTRRGSRKSDTRYSVESIEKI